jgi:hypothetical protein
MTDKEILRHVLCSDHLCLDMPNNYARVFAEVDYFVTQTRWNTSIKDVELRPYDVDPGNYELWDKGGQGVGNLKSLGVLTICLRDSLGEPDWEILARILSHIQNKIELIFGPIEGTEEMRAFARAIQGHPTITHFDTAVSFANTTTLYSALSTLPNLECSVVRQQRPGREEVSTFRSPESMTEFLRAPSLRIVEFHQFVSRAHSA